MPITIQHGPVGAIARLALETGRGRRRSRERELRVSRDLQIAQLSLASQSRGIAGRRPQTFALQRAGARQIARQQPDTLGQRRELRRFVAEAKSAGIFTPDQIKQAEIFANLGDATATRSILGKLPKTLDAARPTARQKELTRQSTAIEGMLQKSTAPHREELNEINRRISLRFPDAESQQKAEMGGVLLPEDIRVQFLNDFARRRQLQGLITQQEQQTEAIQQGLQMGFTISDQKARVLKEVTARQRSAAAVRRAEIRRVNRIEGRNQRTIENELRPLRGRLKIDVWADPDKETARTNKVRTRIAELERELKASFARQDAALGLTPGTRGMTPEEENAAMDAVLAETGGDVEAAMRLWNERSIQ